MAKFYAKRSLLYNGKFYADVALLLPKGSFYAEMHCIKFPCLSCVQKSEYSSLYIIKGNFFTPTALIKGPHPNWVN